MTRWSAVQATACWLLSGVLNLVALLGLCALPAGSHARSVLAIPTLTSQVIDTTGTLQADQKQALEARLKDFEQSKGTQIVVLMVPTTAPEDIVDFTQRVGDTWKIGRKGVGDGLLLVIAKNDRTLRIAPAKTLEGTVPDLAARLIIDHAITPRFRQGDFAGGIDAGLSELFARISGEKLPESTSRPGMAAQSLDWGSWLALFFVAVPVAARLLSALLGRKLGCLFTGAGAGLLAWLLGAGLLLSLVTTVVAGLFALVFGLAALQRGSWSDGGRHGSAGGPPGSRSWPSTGGFRSGGGGDFGGGGASGRW